MHEGGRTHPTRYDGGAFSGGNLDKPDLKWLLDDIGAKRIDIVMVYEGDRLTCSLTDFAKLVELFDANGVSFVSVTQAFNTTNSMGRLTLNVLRSFAQFEREVIAEGEWDKTAASKRKGVWMVGRGAPILKLAPLAFVSPPMVRDLIGGTVRPPSIEALALRLPLLWPTVGVLAIFKILL